MTSPRPTLFQKFADVFPTEKVGENGWGALWRIAFYAARPKLPFIMRTPYYRLWASPTKGPLSYAVVRRGLWEATLTRQLVPHLRPGDLFVDAGANFGHFGMVAASIVGPTGRVFSFEPQAEIFEVLKANIALNGFTWLTPVCAAVGETDGEAVLTTDASSAGGHSLIPAFVGKAGGTTTVPMWSLDSYLAANAPGRRLSALKIDVQEYEAQVIQGVKNTIARDKPLVICEVSAAPDAARRQQVAEILATFSDLNYTATMVWDSAKLTRAASFEEIAAHCSSNAGHIDLVFTPPT